MRHYFSVLEQREEKEVYLANGFTQRNQRGEEAEEKLREELIIDLKQFTQISQEAENLAGKSSDLSETMKRKAESVLRSKITPEKQRDASPSDPLRSSSFRSDGKSPIKIYEQAGRLTSSTERRSTGAFFSSRLPHHQHSGVLLEQIEEELNRTGKKDNQESKKSKRSLQGS